MSGRLGFGIAAALGPDIASAVAPDVERLGYSSFWTNDGVSSPGLPLVAAAQRATHTIRTGIGVIPCDVRSSREIANAVVVVGIDPGRVIIGLGSGRAEHPVDVVRAAIGSLRPFLPHSTSFAVAALGPRMCRLAGELADVVLLNWMTPERIRWARDRIAEGAQRSGRLGGVVVASYVRVAIGPDAAERLAAEAGRYARIPAYARSFEAMRVDPAAVGIAVRDAADVPDALAPYREVLDEAVIRALPKGNDTEDVLELARAAAGQNIARF